jgi:hypothetical protein
MARGTEHNCFSNEYNGLVQVVHPILQLESGLKANGKGVERRRPARMAGGTKNQRSLMELN